MYVVNPIKLKLTHFFFSRKKALRIVTHSYFRANSNSEPLFFNLKTLRVGEIHTLQTGIFMHKYMYTRNLLPLIFHNKCIHNSSIHSYPTRHSNDYHLENSQTAVHQKSLPLTQRVCIRECAVHT